MSKRVIQGFFVGGAARADPAILLPTLVRCGPPAGHAIDSTWMDRPGTSFAPARPAPMLPTIGRHAPQSPVQASQGKGSFEIDPARLGLRAGGGVRLPDAVLAKMETAFRSDFSAVRIHVGPQAARIGAIAFTTGCDIYFAPGRYQPESLQGQKLLGHELAHVVQQRQGRVRTSAGGVSVVQDQMLEAEADRLGLRAALMAHVAPQAPIQRFAHVLPRQPIQRASAGFPCDLCEREFDSDFGLAVHKGRMHKNDDDEMDEGSDREEDTWSDWSAESLDEKELEEEFATSRGPTQRLNYKKFRKKLTHKFHSSKGLYEAVAKLGGGNAPAANTHALLSRPSIKGKKRIRIMAHSSTVNSMRAMTRRYKGRPLRAVQNVVGKKMHIHTEMYLIWILSGGNPKNIEGCMAGLHLVVDKPICKDCIKFVRRANPSMVDDGCEFDKDKGRGTFLDWRDPFKLKTLEPAPKNPFL